MERAWLIAVLLLGGCVTADVIAPDVARDIAPSGRLRAAMNYGNPVLVQRGDGGVPRGVSPDIARELARRLGVPLDFVPYDAAGKVTADATRGAWDLAFVARDPQRAKEIDFTPPYVVIEGAYMVRDDSPLKANEDVDRPGVRIAVSRGSAYDLFLSRALKNATLLRAPSPQASVELFVKERPEALAGVKQPLVAYAASHPGYRVLPGHFMVIEQAMAIPRGRPLAARYLSDFIDELKASGFIAQSLDKSGQSEAMVAP